MQWEVRVSRRSTSAIAAPLMEIEFPIGARLMEIELPLMEIEFPIGARLMEIELPIAA